MGCKSSVLRVSSSNPKTGSSSVVEPDVWNVEVAGAIPAFPIGASPVSSVLQEPCLILNRNWQPITFLPVQTAIVNVMRDMASVLDVQDYLLLTFEEWIALDRESDRIIRTAHSRIPAPEVIVLKQYGERPPRKVVFNRPNLGKRDSFTCQYCGVTLAADDLTVEHVLPRSRGGPTSWENCVAACESCNSRKADQTPQEAGMRLHTVPKRPAWRSRLRAPGTIRPSWQPFLAKELESA
jgi:5-methylcytosine-specific restriction endonuclease McrA